MVHSVIQDTMEPFRDPVDPTLIWTSKSQYYRSLKMRGLAIVDTKKHTPFEFDPLGIPGANQDHIIAEMRRQAQWGMLPKSDLDHDLYETERALKWGMLPISDMERFVCQHEARQQKQMK